MSSRGCWAGSAVPAVLHLPPLLWEQHLIILLQIVPTNASPAANEILTRSVGPQLVSKVGFVTVTKQPLLQVASQPVSQLLVQDGLQAPWGVGGLSHVLPNSLAPSTGCPSRRCRTHE